MCTGLLAGRSLKAAESPAVDFGGTQRRCEPSSVRSRGQPEAGQIGVEGTETVHSGVILTAREGSRAPTQALPGGRANRCSYSGVAPHHYLRSRRVGSG